MTLHGVGIDVVDLPRFRKLLTRRGERFADRWFTPLERRQQGDPALCLARSFAVKEAVWKAVGFEAIPHLLWQDIVAVADGRGGFAVSFRGEAARVVREAEVGAVSATANGDDRVVVAVALAERADLSKLRAS